mmetsp:Transcript_26545/g.68541  ORF Transcript_26545/g.68541 Transcript_26545/m.68541 type:complete len:230 (+) Transcript_26545:87-776(+)
MANVRGLNDLKEDAEEEKRQAYYAGGQGQNGGGSGQEILDPREFMRRARDELGARSIDEYNAEQQQQQQAFAGLGAGRSLNAPPSQPANGQEEPAEPPAPGAVAPTSHTITFWRDGFTVDDGPLRRSDDPENAQFLADINRGQVPRELEASSGGACACSRRGTPLPLCSCLTCVPALSDTHRTQGQTSTCTASTRARRHTHLRRQPSRPSRAQATPCATTQRPQTLVGP